MKRIFTFGCSFTSWVWPTWADILINDYKNKGLKGYNFGKCGAGNQYIFIKLMEAIKKFKINENDMVIICWTSLYREDRYVNKNWITPGNIYTQNIYNDDFVNSWADPVHYSLRDCAIISATNTILKNIGCKYIKISMSDLVQIDSAYPNMILDDVVNTTIFYGDSINMDTISIMNYLKLKVRTDDVIESRPKTYWDHDKIKKIQPEWHPTPAEHYDYLTNNILPLLKTELSPNTIRFINVWIEKFDKMKQPINLDKTGWELNHKELLFDPNRPIKRLV